MNWEAAVEKLVRDVLIPGGVDEKVINAIRKTPRHEFIPPAMRRDAYADTALPIGARQTISSPYIVSIMTQELDVAPTHKVLEIGTGSGYQAAVLSPLAKEVYSIEIVPELGKKAARVLTRLGYKNVFTKIGDGFKGWPEHAPFDRIIVTCSPEDVPQPLTDQLVEGGLIVVPTGERYQQTLYLMRKKNGKLEREALRPTLFVPMTGQAEEDRKVLPDPARPVLFNGNFEEPLADNGYLPGWYYQQNLTLMKATAEDKADGTYARFENDTRGQPAHLLQGLALDGRVVRKIELSASMRFKDIRPGLDATEQPAVMIRFYDSLRGLIDSQIIRPRRGRTNWQEIKRVFRVPKNSREAIVSLGLFGASGTADFDNLTLSPTE
ncbi:MAG TPA: protein-L-isoaspartate(D-aspartate) O-methyltransferase [Planctomycetaceae bacterium]|nr:protein-L-isoaspartate(D-aspartate) O-methyltransferase [Planctomycetaceae bacterium]